jgi:tRNA(Arg) A34 adenosine deaminase TadA
MQTRKRQPTSETQTQNNKHKKPHKHQEVEVLSKHPQLQQEKSTTTYKTTHPHNKQQHRCKHKISTLL